MGQYSGFGETACAEAGGAGAWGAGGMDGPGGAIAEGEAVSATIAIGVGALGMAVLEDAAVTAVVGGLGGVS